MPDWLYWAIWGCYAYYALTAGVLWYVFLGSWGNPHNLFETVVMFVFPIASAFWLSYAFLG